MKRTLLAFILLICLSACNDKTEKNKTALTGGLSSVQALSTFKLPEGFKIELMAAEPMISDPVAMDVDENGNIYVVELHVYQWIAGRHIQVAVLEYSDLYLL